MRPCGVSLLRTATLHLFRATDAYCALLLSLGCHEGTMARHPDQFPRSDLHERARQPLRKLELEGVSRADIHTPPHSRLLHAHALATAEPRSALSGAQLATGAIAVSASAGAQLGAC